MGEAFLAGGLGRAFVRCLDLLWGPAEVGPITLFLKSAWTKLNVATHPFWT